MQPVLSSLKLSWVMVLIVGLLLAACNDDKPKNNTPTAETPTAPTIRVVVSRATVFSEPNRNAEVVYNLVEGDTLATAGKSEPDELGTIYYLVRIGDRLGWVSATQVELNVSPDALVVMDIPDNPTPPPDATPLPSFTPSLSGTLARIITPIAEALSYPGSEGVVVFTLNQDEVYQLVAQTPINAEGVAYYGTRIEDTLVWLPSTAIEVTGDTTLLQVVVTPTPIPTFTAVAEMPSLEATHSAPNVTPSPTLTPPPTSNIPTNTPTLRPTATLAAVQPINPPPLTIDIPDGWEQGHFRVPVRNQFVESTVNLSIYEGALPNGMTGRIWLLWHFPSYLPLNPENLDLWPDSTMYLRSFLFQGCNIGLNVEGRKAYRVGGQDAFGSTFQAVDCQNDTPDTAGWFMALQYGDENFSFYMGVEPARRVTEGIPYLQGIVNTIQFTES